MGGSVFTPKQQNWHWYADNNAEPVGGDSLAAENNKPTLADSSQIRLRLCVNETGGKASNNATVTLEYSINDSSFNSFGPSADWNYADGQATEAATIAGLLLSDTSNTGEYCESATNTVSFPADTATEFDVCIVPVNATGNTTYYFRCMLDGTEVPLNTGESHPQVLTASGPTNTDITPTAGSLTVQGIQSPHDLGIIVPTEVDV